MVQAAVRTAISIDQSKGDERPWVGRSIERVEDAGLLSGRGRFIDDIGFCRQRSALRPLRPPARGVRSDRRLGTVEGLPRLPGRS
jgi:2-furoyl-CoA dehydrogenase large subunit